MNWLLTLLGLTPVADVADWTRWWSTRLAALSGACGAAAFAYGQLPPQWQAQLPDWLGGALGVASIASAFLIPMFRSAEQKALTQKETPRGPQA